MVCYPLYEELFDLLVTRKDKSIDCINEPFQALSRLENNESQLSEIVNSSNHRISIIQGPPGICMY